MRAFRRHRPNFWAYNNGITVVAEAFDRDATLNLVRLTNFSIVNGCQTTVLIGKSDPTKAATVTVLLRVVAAPPQLVDNIIRYTNSQNPIRLWEMSARDPEQQRLRRDLEALPEPWFYAFRRGEFEAVVDKSRYGSPQDRRVLPFPQSIQYLAAFRGLPVEAYKDRGRLFSSHKTKVVPPGLDAKELLWAWQVGQATTRAAKSQLASTQGDEQKRLILTRGASYYATFVAHQLLAARNGPDFVARIDPARLTDKASQRKLDGYATLAMIYYLRATLARLRTEPDLGLVLRSPTTNEDLARYTEEELVQERLVPGRLDAALPVFPKSSK